mmetsp:Transcript_34948/g.96599  ORF Transcript_34948/g.96599 Transcript_34948/m.96599 type:complete len:549 (+) Transcript_34948:81-1727(+)
MAVKAHQAGAFQHSFLSRVPRPLYKASKARVQLVAGKGHDEALPAVVSVKKSAKGCAVVILRDPALVERCVFQRVAVVDGVCVELRRHTRRSKEEAEGEEVDTPVGIFVAWGTRVERKVPVSEEGLEEYFNSLEGSPTPDGLVTTPPFAEGHVCFPLASETFATLAFNIAEEVADTEEILSSIYCGREAIQALWEAKGRLDSLWSRSPPPMARSLMLRVARSQLFPHSGEGGQEHENRAGDKLAELSQIVGLLDGVPHGSAFLDLCGGPGAWSQHLLGHTELALRGFGFTLKAGAGADGDWQAEGKDEWYGGLYDHPDWTALWGADGTGDLLKLGNLENCVAALGEDKVFLCVADGGFSDDTIPPNLLELYFYRLFLAELYMAASCLKPGGRFVCKLYTTFSAATAGILFLATRLFDSVHIVKPMSSRVTGPERYLAATGFRENAETPLIRAALGRSHNLGGGASPLVKPLLTPAVSYHELMRDCTFTFTMIAMVTTLCDRQATALNAVVDRANYLEDMAMSSATCTEAFTRPAAPRRPMEKDNSEEN